MPRASSPKSTPKYSDDEIVRILLEHRHFLSADELCAKWKITRKTLRDWKDKFGLHYGTVRQQVIAALYKGPVSNSPDLRSWLDYMSKSVLSSEEIRTILDDLVDEGVAKKSGILWIYNRDHSKNGTSFIF